MDTGMLVCNLAMGLCVAAASWAGQGAAARLLDFTVEDLGDRLRSLRFTTPHLRRWVITGVAIVVFWPAAFLVNGDGQTAAELGRLKGEFQALEQASVQKNCGFQFQQQQQQPAAQQQQTQSKS